MLSTNRRDTSNTAGIVPSRNIVCSTGRLRKQWPERPQVVDSIVTGFIFLLSLSLSLSLLLVSPSARQVEPQPQRLQVSETVSSPGAIANTVTLATLGVCIERAIGRATSS